ncbi:MAG: RICIN domain-containing protein [Paludibacter sp.]|nr:RICIN domain-containing protein [Paludibacter sp.]
MRLKKHLLIFTLSCLTATMLADSGIYICGHFRRDRTRTVTALKASGFTFGILFNVHVEPDGTLITDGEVICKDGQYVFDQKVAGYPNDIAQVDYVDDVNALLSGKTSLLRLEHCIGGWGNHAYKNISDLVNAQGTGPTSILYRNFKALKDAIPAVIAVNNDIEHDYEANSQSQFHIMLHDIGFKTTIAPYTNKSYWDSFVAKVEAARPGAVDRNYLQIYGGGSNNNPQNWRIGNLPIYGSRDIEANPGLTHQEIVTAMTNWKSSAGIVGGFYWNYNYARDLKKFAAPVNEVFGGGAVADRGSIVAMVYPVKDYKAPQTDFVLGSYTKSQIQTKGFDVSKLASLRIKEGVKMVLFSADNFSGDSVVLTADVTDVATLTGLPAVNSLRVLADNPEELAGKDFIIKNKQSSFVIKPSRNSTATTIYQMVADTTEYSLWTFEQAEYGLYKIVNKGSGRVLQTVNTSEANYVHDGLLVIQSLYDGSSNQHFIVKANGDDSYKLIPYCSQKYIGMADDKQLLEKMPPVQRRSSSVPSTDWLLIPAEEISGTDTQLAESLFNVYPRLVSELLTIESPLGDVAVKIVDVNGRVVMQRQHISGSVDVSGLSAGMYVVIMEAGGERGFVKIVKR